LAICLRGLPLADSPVQTKCILARAHDVSPHTAEFCTATACTMSSISKTDYILWRACPKNAWLRIHRPDVYYSTELTEYEQSIVEMGIEVEGIARRLFPNGTIVSGSGTATLQETRSLNAANTPTLFHAVFEREGCLAVVDVLRCKTETKYLWRQACGNACGITSHPD
jgi:hypothetical protein